MARIDQDAYDKLKTQDWNYEMVADEIGIDQEKFAELMRTRFDTKDNSKEGKTYHLTYTLEWAERVKKGDHFMAADKKTEQVLRDAGYD